MPAAASTAVRTLLDGPVRPARVIGVVRSAVYVVLDPDDADGSEPDGGVVVIESAGALRLPCAVVVASRAVETPFAAVRRGDPATVGAGRVRAGELEVAVARWWAPRGARHRRPAAGTVRAVSGGLPPLESPLAVALAPLLGWLAGSAATTDPRAAVRDVVGLGSGVTPAGDDVLVGALVALRAARDPHAGPLAAAVRAVGPGRTTALSTALLHHAQQGWALPALVDLVDALGDPVPDGPALPPELVRRVDRLVSVGHSSGTALAHGAVLAAGAAARRPTTAA